MADERKIEFPVFLQSGPGVLQEPIEWYLWRGGGIISIEISSASPAGTVLDFDPAAGRAAWDYTGFPGRPNDGVWYCEIISGNSVWTAGSDLRFPDLPDSEQETGSTIRLPTFHWPNHPYPQPMGTWGLFVDDYTEEPFYNSAYPGGTAIWGPPPPGWHIEPDSDDSPLWLDVTIPDGGLDEIPGYGNLRLFSYTDKNGLYYFAHYREPVSVIFGSCISPTGSIYFAINYASQGVKVYRDSVSDKGELSTVSDAKNPSIFMHHGAFYLAYVDNSKKTVLSRSLDGARTFTLMSTEIWDSNHKNAVVAPMLAGGAVTVAISDKKAWFRRSTDLRDWSEPVELTMFTDPAMVQVHEKSISGQNTLLATDGVTLARSLDGGKTWQAI